MLKRATTVDTIPTNVRPVPKDKSNLDNKLERLEQLQYALTRQVKLGRRRRKCVVSLSKELEQRKRPVTAPERNESQSKRKSFVWTLFFCRSAAEQRRHGDDRRLGEHSGPVESVGQHARQRDEPFESARQSDEDASRSLGSAGARRSERSGASSQLERARRRNLIFFFFLFCQIFVFVSFLPDLSECRPAARRWLNACKAQRNPSRSFSANTRRL